VKESNLPPTDEESHLGGFGEQSRIPFLLSHGRALQRLLNDTIKVQKKGDPVFGPPVRNGLVG
jgi:hypothetical protein